MNSKKEANNNKNNQVTLSFVDADPKKRKTDGRKRRRTEGKKEQEEDKKQISDKGTNKRGIWTKKREMAVLTSYVTHRPFAVPYKTRGVYWERILKEVNEQDESETPLKRVAMIAKFHDLLDQYKHFFSENVVNKSSGINRFNSDIERAAYNAWNQYQEDIKCSADEKIKKREDIEKTEKRDKRMQGLAKEGKCFHKNKGKERDDGPSTAITGSAINPVETTTTVEPIRMIEDEPESILERSNGLRRKEHSEIMSALQTLHEDNQKLQQMFMMFLNK